MIARTKRFSWFCLSVWLMAFGFGYFATWSNAYSCNVDLQNGMAPDQADVQALAEWIVSDRTQLACQGGACDFDGDGETATLSDLAVLIEMANGTREASGCEMNNAPVYVGETTWEVSDRQRNEITLAAFDPDGDAFDIETGEEGLPAWISIQDGKLVATPKGQESQTVVLRFTDAQNAETVTTLQIVVHPNLPPVVSGPAVIEVYENEVFSSSFSVNDPEGGPLTIQFTPSLPGGVQWQHTVSKIGGQTSETGTYGIVMKVRDIANETSSFDFQLMVKANAAPVWIYPGAGFELAAVRGVAVSTSAEASDAEGGALVYSVQSGALPPGLIFGENGRFSGTPEQVGDYPVELQVRDPIGKGAVISGVLKVKENIAPGVIGARAPAASFLVPFSVSYDVADPEGQPVSLDLSGSLPPGITFGETGVFSGLPTQPGRFPLVLHAKDPVGNITSFEMEIQVVDYVAPVWQEPTGPLTINLLAGTGISQLFKANGQVGETVAYSLSGSAPPGIELNSTAVLTGTAMTPGSWVFEVLAADPQQNISPLSVTITVAPNSPPLLVSGSSALSFSTRVGVAFSESWAVADPEGYSASFVVSGPAPPGLAWQDGRLGGMPVVPGQYDLSIASEDIHGFSASFPIRLAIASNEPPQWLSNSAALTFSAWAELPLQLTLQAADPEGTAIIYSVSGNLPEGVAFSQAGELAGTSPNDGVYPVTIVATDAEGFSNSFPLMIDLSYPLDILPPVLAIDPPVVLTGYISQSSPILTISAVDNRSLPAVSPSGVLLDGVDVTPPVSASGKTASWTLGAGLLEGAHTLHVTVADDAGNQSTISLSFIVDSIVGIQSLEEDSGGGALVTGQALVLKMGTGEPGGAGAARINGVTVSMKDDGVDPDFTVGDGVYSGRLAVSQPNLSIVSAPIELTFTDAAGNTDVSTSALMVNINTGGTPLPCTFNLAANRQECTVTLNQPGQEMIRIANPTSQAISFSLTLNQKPFFNTKQEILNEIQAMPDEVPGETLGQKIWRWIVLNSIHRDAFSQNSWQHNPVIFYNSIGFHLCDDVAIQYYHLATAAGLPARVWALNGHVVPEVFENGRWAMYDPDIRVYFYNTSLQVAGVEELAANPGLITSPVPPFTPWANCYWANCDTYWASVYAPIFASAGDNAIYDAWQLEEWYGDRPAEIKLPPGASLTVPGLFSQSILLNSGADVSMESALARLTLPVGTQSEIVNPFVLYQASGDATVTYDEGTAQMDLISAFWSNRINNRDFPILKLNVVEARSPVFLDYLVNKKRTMLSNINHVTISSQDAYSLVVEAIPGN